jgi:D-xylose transport system ATP-binding protein
MLCDRANVMKNGQLVGTVKVDEVSEDDMLGMIIAGKCPANAIPGPGALQTA